MAQTMKYSAADAEALYLKNLRRTNQGAAVEAVIVTMENKNKVKRRRKVKPAKARFRN